MPNPRCKFVLIWNRLERGSQRKAQASKSWLTFLKRLPRSSPSVGVAARKGKLWEHALFLHLCWLQIPREFNQFWRRWDWDTFFFSIFLVYLETSVFNWIWIWKLILVRLGSSSNQVGTQRSLLIRVSPNLGRLGAKDTTLPEGMPETHALGKEKECLILSGKLLEGQWFGVLGYSFQTQDLIWKRSARGHGPPMYPIHGAED